LNRKFAKAFFKGIWIYALLVWLYIIVVINIYPYEVNWPFSTLVPIRQDYVAVVAFALSGICFIIWEYLRSSPSPA
jgi:hypothetical protein